MPSKKKPKKAEWAPFEKMLNSVNSKAGICYGHDRRVMFAEVISPSKGSFFVRIPDNLPIQSPKPCKEIYKVNNTFSEYYSPLQTHLASNEIPLISIDGEFLVSGTEIYSTIKDGDAVLASKSKTLKEVIEAAKVDYGLTLSSDSSSEEEDSSSEDSSEVKRKIREDVIEELVFASEDELDDFFENPTDLPEQKSSKKKKFLLATSLNGENDREEETELSSGVLYPLLSLKELFKKINDSSFSSFLTVATASKENFELKVVSDLVSQLETKFNLLKKRIFEKVESYTSGERDVKSAIKNYEKTLTDHIRVLEKGITLDPETTKVALKEAKDSLRESYLKLHQIREDRKFALRNFISAIEDISSID